VSELLFDARVVANHCIAADIWILRLAATVDPAACHAGSFLHLQVDPGPVPLFRRAYSILSSTEEHVEILYKVTGIGTRLLVRRQPGDEISAMGPLGNTFSQPRAGEQAVMVAGGVGLPPVLRWAEQLMAGGVAPDHLTFIYGAATAEELVLRDRVDALGVHTLYATDDGSYGHHGLVTELLERQAESAGHEGRRVRFYACGPGAMLAACSHLAGATGIPGDVALETPMPCGSGVCLGCIMPCRTERGDVVFRRTCMDGPIFAAREVVWA